VNPLPPPLPVPELAGVDSRAFHAEVRAAGRPVVFRGLVGDWPAVSAARAGDRALADYLDACGTTRPVQGLAAPPEAGRRFFYNDQLTGFNFTKHEGRLEDFLASLLDLADTQSPPATAVQSETVPDLSPALAEQNQLDWLPGVIPRIWIGNRIQVAPHYDLKENLACCVAGARRFTLFPPEQVANLYAGPFELTPAGTPISMVDFSAPDLERYPRFASAWAAAQQVTLGPGDVLYIPYCWWHGVESLEPLNVLINYWWSEEPEGVAGPYDALLHAMLAYRHLAPAERAVWRTILDHYVFEANGDPAAHLPAHARGILGPASPQLFSRMRTMLRQVLR
jgi:hypothetical protein